ncbi:MAG: hypothetical protein HYZ75_00755 [Elusimicrobia bacterium]|nr:hypothetical protein [Elusimicrobiota bacterium]
MGTDLHQPVRILELIAMRTRGVRVEAVAFEYAQAMGFSRASAGVHLEVVRRHLTMLRRFCLLRRRKGRPEGGRPPYTWTIAPLGLKLLDLLGPVPERLTLRIREVEAVAAGCKVLSRIGSLKRGNRAEIQRRKWGVTIIYIMIHLPEGAIRQPTRQALSDYRR